MPRTPHPDPAVDGLAAQSVAGEEDPGAALDEQPQVVPHAGKRPGDEAAPGTPGTGETVCERCGGRGTIDGGARCPQCGGSGKVIHGIGGG